MKSSTKSWEVKVVKAQNEMKSLTNLQESCKHVDFFGDLSIGLGKCPHWSQRAEKEPVSYSSIRPGGRFWQECMSQVTWEFFRQSAENAGNNDMQDRHEF